jgi:hypothetical protein
MSYNNVGKVWTPGTYAEYLKKLTPPSWAKSVTLHHAWAPSLAQRPKGLIIQHIVNIKGFYQGKGWRSGPHLFTDEDQIFGMTPLSETGVHAISFNSNSIGIEALGNYDSEDPFSGRGLEVWKTTAAATKATLDWLKLPVSSSTVKFHNEDPKTSKSCPGYKIKKDWVLDLINSANTSAVPLPTTPSEEIIKFVVEKKGYDYKIAVSMLKKKSNMVFFGDDWIEGAWYDASKAATVAPIPELELIKPA